MVPRTRDCDRTTGFYLQGSSSVSSGGGSSRTGSGLCRLLGTQDFVCEDNFNNTEIAAKILQGRE